MQLYQGYCLFRTVACFFPSFAFFLFNVGPVQKYTAALNNSWSCWVFVAVCGSLLAAESRGRLQLWATASVAVGAWVWGTQGVSVAVACGLSCLVACDLPRPGVELVSPALAGRFLTTGPNTRKSQRYLLFRYVTLSESVLVTVCIYSKQIYLHGTVNFSVTKR